MKLLLALLTILAALALQAGLGRSWSGVHAWVDVLLVPVALHAAGRSQRMAMGVGCVCGLLSDAWFGAGSFGLGGFKLTLLGWLVGGAGSRVDLNHGPGRFVTGALICLGAALIEPAVRPLLDQPAPLPAALPLAVKAMSTGLLAVVSGSILDRVGFGRSGEYAGGIK